MKARTPKEPEDAKLVRLAQQGDLQAFDQLIAKYERRVIGLCYRHLQQYEDACDLAQEIFIQVFHRLKDFEGRSSFSTWLYRVSLNACYNRHRFLKAKGRGGVTSLEGLLEGPGRADGDPRSADSSLLMRSKEPGALSAMEAEESRSQLIQALDSLEPHSHKAIDLVDIEGLSYEEAADILEIPVNTVRSRLSRARAALKTKIERLRKKLGET
jgi:RNA polymerase sigma-70 factor (ECF subfamily)